MARTVKSIEEMRQSIMQDNISNIKRNWFLQGKVGYSGILMAKGSSGAIIKWLIFIVLMLCCFALIGVSK